MAPNDKDLSLDVPSRTSSSDSVASTGSSSAGTPPLVTGLGKAHFSYSSVADLPLPALRKTVDSAIPAFFKKTVEQRVDEVARRLDGVLTADDVALLGENAALPMDVANEMVENVLGTLQLPYALATNFVINGRDVLVPMAVEEPSVVAAASFGAKLCRSSGGFQTSAAAPIMVGQILLVNVDAEAAVERIRLAEIELVGAANRMHPSLKKRGGGVQSVVGRVLQTRRGSMVVVHVTVDVRDSMGANTVTTICEKLAPQLEELTGATARMRILSNLCPERVFTAEAVWTKDELEASVKSLGLRGDEVVEAMLDASAFAEADEFRACTHNKGIMNGVDSVALATLNDCRAIESGAHCFAAYEQDHYQPLTTYDATPEGHLRGTIRIPLALGVRGGATGSHPLARLSLKIMQIETSDELGQIMAAVGLAQNFAAMRALVTEGLCRGHMRLHAKNIAMSAGATGAQVARVAEIISDEKNVTLERARQVLALLAL
eukprot:Unigene11153_Nuclearia_a/m.34126 Unigene11153_Nuclearia_a/g.34126  ORF Unigene11153_Nuclearia_a/g.34126 Unigene11153_Nuclearia_a/m.34126 type:complete len:491 (+) Unigene11153_Nuclearia_a:50-1522(+)